MTGLPMAPDKRTADNYRSVEWGVPVHSGRKPAIRAILDAAKKGVQDNG